MVLQIMDNEALRKQEQEQIDKELEERQNEPLILGLASHLRKCWDAARQAKNL